MPTYTTTLSREDGREIEVEAAFHPASPRGRDRYGWTEPASWEHEDSIDIDSARFTDTGEAADLTDEERKQVVADVESQRRDDEEDRAVAAYEARNEVTDYDIERAENDYESSLFRDRD